MDSPDFSKMSDSNVLKAVQPGITSDVDKYYIELAHWILDKAGSVDIKDPVLKSVEDAQVEYQYAKDDFESDPSPENNKKMVKAEIAMLKAEIAENKAKMGRSAKMEPQQPMDSSIFKGLKSTKGGLKTRRRKRRNGPSRVRRHRSRRVSGRKDKA